MNNIYVVIYTGYEGIEGLLWATTDEEDAKKVFREYKEEAAQLQKELNDYIEKGEAHERWDREHAWYEKMEEYDGACSVLERQIEPHRYCMQKFDGREFSCVCSEMGYPLGKKWFY